MKYLWWTDNIKGVDTTLTVSDIQDKCDSLVMTEGKVGLPPRPSKLRNSTVAFLHPSTSQDVFGLMWHLASKTNKHVFGFDIESVDDIQYGEYNKNGKYDWHVDTNWTNPDSVYHRKISIVIQLSDSNEYEGGDFEIDDMDWGDWTKGVREKGTIIVFPSFLRHRVTPITKGTRKSLIAWIDGVAFR